VNLAHDGNLKLITPDPPSAQLANKTRYVLRFKPPTGGAYIASDPDLSSPGFNIIKATVNNLQVTSSTTASATATTSLTRIRATPSGELPTSSAVPEESGVNISPSKAAGLTVGLILAVMLLVVLEVAYLTWRRKRRRGRAVEEGGSGSGLQRRRLGSKERGLFTPVAKIEMPSESPWLSPELPGDTTWGRARIPELHGGGRWFGGIRFTNDNGTPRRTGTLNSSVVELEAGRGG
jgi:hypothetical protein